MTAQLQTPTTTELRAARPAAGIPQVHRGVRHELRVIGAVWKRELVRAFRQRVHLLVSLLGPVLFLVVIGTGVSAIAAQAGGMDAYLTFLFPGILVLSVQATAVGAGVSIVQDRQIGILRGMLVAPVRRSSVVIGKCLGGATSASVQGALLLTLSGFVGISYRPDVLILMFLVLTLVALCMTVVGALGAVAIRRADTFQAVIAIILMPMYLLSGAMIPSSLLPGWLSPVVLINPLTYAVDSLRRTASLGATVHQGFPAAVDVYGWVPPVAFEIGAMCVLSVLLLGCTVRAFSRTP